MTIEELYQWALNHNIEDYNITLLDLVFTKLQKEKLIVNNKTKEVYIKH